MSEVHPDFHIFREGPTKINVKSSNSSSRPDPLVPMPKVKAPKDPKIEEDAILRIMQLAIYGAVMHAGQNQENQFEATERVVKLFKEANLIM